jgi:hypothetical protein
MKKFLVNAVVCVIFSVSSIINAQTIPLNPDPYWSYVPTYVNARSLCFADINNDGYPELLIARESDTNYIFMNNAGTIDSLPSWGSNDADVSVGIACGDYDNDGDLDMAIANPDLFGGRLKLYRNDNGTITQDAVWASNTKGGMWCTWGDVDNDGDLDLASSDMLDYPAVHYNNSGVLETTPSWEATDYNIDEFCAWVDIDSSGWLDLAVGNFHSGGPPLRVYYNDGMGTLENPASWVSQANPGSFYTGGVSAGDIDKDGWVDVFTANGAGASVEQNNTGYYNNSGILDSVPTWYSGDVYNSIGSVLGDINGDGYLEFAVANINSNGPCASVYPNNNGTLSTMPWNPNTTQAWWGIDVGDVDRDGITINEDTLTGDGEGKLFYLSILPIHRILEITVDETPIPITDYACDLKSGWVTFKNTPSFGSQIIFEYEHSIDMELVVSGTWIFENTNAGISENVVNIPELKLKTYPNPFVNYTKISFSLPSPDYVSLKIFDISGRMIKHWSGFLKTGEHSFILDGDDLTQGIYFYSLKTQGKTYINKIVKGG